MKAEFGFKGLADTFIMLEMPFDSLEAEHQNND